jgi:NAD(P)-dependent dehydrogenase (short-subunit alcohol dehydrogenase family)
MQTDDGIEQTLAIDYFAPVLLTFGLLPLLRATTNSRIIMMASPAEMFGRVRQPALAQETLK